LITCMALPNRKSKKRQTRLRILHEPIWEEALLKIDNTREHFAVLSIAFYRLSVLRPETVRGARLRVIL
jgi:hypothetical protein